jgi:hypothetical protein
MSVPIRCHTNVDEGRHGDWPTFLACRPIVGDSITSTANVTLRIIKITHKQVEVESTGDSKYLHSYLELELNL